MGNKNGKKTFPAPVRDRVLSALVKGEKLSVIELTNICFVSDVRGHISRLRRIGYTINDEWVETKNGRYKRYFMPQHAEL